MEPDSSTAYSKAGVDTDRAERAINGLVEVLQSIDPGGPKRTVLRSGHYANVLAIDERTGIAVSTDGVGTKLIVAEQMGRFDTVGIDCVAMNVNDLICIGARPIALVDYLAVEQAEGGMLREIALGLKAGAESAGIEIPGGELAELGDAIRGHPSPFGFDLVGSSFGTVELERIVTGDNIVPDDVIIGLPSNGVHSNGMTLARTALFKDAGFKLDDRPEELERSLGEELLRPTEIYVSAILDLLESSVEVKGLAHITGGGVSNLLRLNSQVGYSISNPLPAPAIFSLIQKAGSVSIDEMFRVFNMGCGFCCIVSRGDADAALENLQRHHPKADVIGTVCDEPGEIFIEGVESTKGNGRKEL